MYTFQCTVEGGWPPGVVDRAVDYWHKGPGFEATLRRKNNTTIALTRERERKKLHAMLL